MKCNQPAFPVALDGAFINSENNLKPFAGMSLRDYFAAAVLQGLIASKAHSLAFKSEDDAKYCFDLADAMLKARGK